MAYWAKHLDTLINHAYEQALQEDGLTPRQWQVLSTLSWGDRSVASLRETLAGFRCDEEDSLETALQVLSARDWLTDDVGQLALTPAGQAGCEEIRRHVDGVKEAVAEGISPEDYRTTVDTLKRMCDNVSVPPPTP